MTTLLLDTHVLLWWLAKPQKLSRKTSALIERGDVVVSAADGRTAG
jgi:PIN domain nuclease of toxin-antitoxin system